MRILLLAWATLGALPALAWAQSTSLQGSVTGVLREAPDAPRVNTSLGSNATLKVGGDNAAAVYLWTGPIAQPTSQVSLVLDKGTEIQLAGSAGRRLIQIVRGSLFVTYESKDREALLIAGVPGRVPWVRLTRGKLWVFVAPTGVRTVLLDEGGQAVRFDTPLPAENPQTAPGGQPVAVDVTGRHIAETLAESLQSATLARSTGSWLELAQSGDILPSKPEDIPASSYAVRPPSATASVQGQATTPTVAAAVTQTLITGPGASGATTTFSGINALLTSGNAASVVVATRFERARLVGVGTGTGAGRDLLGFNTQVREPLRLNLR